MKYAYNAKISNYDFILALKIIVIGLSIAFMYTTWLHATVALNDMSASGYVPIHYRLDNEPVTPPMQPAALSVTPTEPDSHITEAYDIQPAMGYRMFQSTLNPMDGYTTQNLRVQ